ncbi:MAG: phage Gp37/Gp68 family protein [Caulobacteraceae bacterium]|nr:phage Gp37/Gp68 family protein [Caulobacteraceae bacterium]
MADKSLIEWTDTTWNIVTGCSLVSPGCTNCYAMRLAGGRMQNHPSRVGLTTETKAGPVWNGQVRFNAAWLTQPLAWKKPRKIFVAAHGDLFHEGITDAQLDQIFAVMALCPQHVFQILTKRPERMRAYLTTDPVGRVLAWTDAVLDLSVTTPLSVASVYRAQETLSEGHTDLANVWLGVSVEDQARADERIPDLLATPAAVRWISAEPLLGPINLNHIKMVDRQTPDGGWETGWESALNGCRFDPWNDETGESEGHPRLDWVVLGGESGPCARPMHPDWARQIRDQCAAAGVPFLFKQWGAWGPGVNIGPSTQTETCAWWFNDGWDFRDVTVRESEEMHYEDEPDLWRVGKARAGRLLDGVLHDGYPA